jgi:hypothetical protein
MNNQARNSGSGCAVSSKPNSTAMTGKNRQTAPDGQHLETTQDNAVRWHLADAIRRRPPEVLFADRPDRFVIAKIAANATDMVRS